MMNQGVNTVIKPGNNTIICKTVGSVNIDSSRWDEFGYLSTIVDGDYTIIVFERTITSIPSFGFNGITNINEVYLTNSVTSIGEWAFNNCSSLRSITIPNGVTSIGNYAFYYCNGLTSISYNGTISQWNAITKGANWRHNVPATVVHCTDGDVEI